MLKEPYASQFEIGVSPEQLAKLTVTSRAFDEIFNRAPDRHAPYVGASGLCHQGRHPRLGAAQGAGNL
jgi:2-isopropylmalate synthase